MNLNLNKKKILKKNIKKNFNIFSIYKLNNIIAIQKYKLFLNHIKLINLFITKKSNKIIKKSKKDQFKKQIDSIIKKKYFNKEININKNKLNKYKIKKKKIKKRNYSLINLPLYKYTKKSIGSRMGKGLGSTFNYYFLVNPGYIILYFFNWEIKLLKNTIKNLKQFLPLKNKYII